MTADRWIDVNLSALGHNLDVARATVQPARLMLVVKDDAYGHGLSEVVTAALAAGIEALGTLDVATAINLRAAGVDKSVLLFAWNLVPGEDASDAVAARVDLGISSISELQAVARHRADAPARIHLEIDTGLGRNGARPEAWPSLVHDARALEAAGIVDIVGVWTHLAEASFDEDSAAIEAFRAAVAILQDGRQRPVLQHLAASAASFSRPDSRFDMARVGAFVYGIAPGDGISPASLGLRPVMALRARIVDVDVDGRGRLPLGSTDGLPSTGPGVLLASHDGAPISIVRIDLHSTLLAPGLELGDTVTLFGDGMRGEPTVQEWADALGTIGEEVVVRLTQRIERRPTEEG
jgi:alanine racemase